MSAPTGIEVGKVIGWVLFWVLGVPLLGLAALCGFWALLLTAAGAS